MSVYSWLSDRYFLHMPRFMELQQNNFEVNFNCVWQNQWRKCPQYNILHELIMHENINISHATELSNDDRWQFRWWSLLRRYKQSNHVDWNGMPKCHYWSECWYQTQEWRQRFTHRDRDKVAAISQMADSIFFNENASIFIELDWNLFRGPN